MLKKLLYKIAVRILRIYWKVAKPKTFGVRVLVRDKSNYDKFLVLRHSYGDQTLWSIPGGGYKPKKEASRIAAKRELNEETGLDVNVQLLDQIGEYKTRGEGKQDTVTIFVCSIESAEEMVVASEIEEVRWVSIDEFHNLESSRVTRRAVELLKK